MLGLILIYWIGKFFYQLAKDNNQNKWLFAILGIAVFYVTQFVFAIVLVFLNEFGVTNVDLEGIGINIIAIPIGFIGCYLFYLLLQKSWKKNKIDVSENIQYIGSSDED